MTRKAALTLVAWTTCAAAWTHTPLAWAAPGAKPGASTDGTDSAAPAEGDKTKVHGTKRKKKKPAKSAKVRNAPTDADSAAELSSAIGSEKPDPAAEPKPNSPFFPPWGRSGFDWTLGPLVGLGYASRTTPAGTVQTTTSELGLRGGLSDIPLVPGNPGLGLGFDVGQSWGETATSTKTDAGSVSRTVGFTRTTAGLHLTGYYGFLRQQLGFTRGRIAYDDAAKSLVQSAGVHHDLGVLVLGWLSAHYTTDFLRAYGDRYKDVLLTQQDHWLHTRLFTDVLQFHIDLGPGVTYGKEYAAKLAGDGTEEVAKGSTYYVRMLTGMHLFWKLGASGEAKYVARASSEELGSLAGTRLPDQDVNKPSNVALPEDSLTASLFAGISDLFHGLGIGWQYNLEVLRMSSKKDGEKQTTKSNGPVIGFSATM